MAGERLYEEQELTLTKDGNRILKIECNPTNLLGQGEEGLFCLFLKLDDGREAFYSTRVAYYEGTPLDEAFTLSTSMIEAMLSKNTISLQQYMSFTGSDAQMNLNHVTLESTPRQATWAGLEPRVSTERTLRIYEISATQIEFSWLYTANTTENAKEIYYDVEEYFSIRRRSEKNYILAYERFMQEKFPTDDRCMGTTSILLGIQDRDNVSMFKDASGKKVAFTVDHAVYAYNYTNNEMTQVLAFDAGTVNSHVRDRMYRVKILNMNENGDLNLAMSGYFPSGSHEGECGLALYYYDNEHNALKEVSFVRDSVNAVFWFAKRFSGISKGIEKGVPASASGFASETGSSTGACATTASGSSEEVSANTSRSGVTSIFNSSGAICASCGFSSSTGRTFSSSLADSFDTPAEASEES